MGSGIGGRQARGGAHLSVEIHLVDGTYELFRCFHGAPRFAAEDGREVGACRGLLETLAALLRVDGAMHVAVAFDSVGLARPEKGKDAVLATQVPLAVDVCRALGFVVWPAARWSADDVLASAAATYAADDTVDRIVICSADLDFLQCVRGERVVAMNRSRRTVTDEAAVLARFGVAPAALPDLFALSGDRSDGVAGVPGWGRQTASALLARWGSIEAIPGDHAGWDVGVRGAAARAVALRAHRDEALFARDLLRLNTELPIRTPVADLRWRGPDAGRLAEVCRRLAVDRTPTVPVP